VISGQQQGGDDAKRDQHGGRCGQQKGFSSAQPRAEMLGCAKADKKRQEATQQRDSKLLL
jgi:hypothetical protein